MTSGPSSETQTVRPAPQDDGARERAETPLVELRQVSLAYGGGAGRMLALEDATLSIAKGEFIAVVGPSGCGKSTLMKLVTGLLPPTGGEVRVHGQVVKGPIRGVGMAFQAPTLMPWRTTLDNILLPLEVVEPHKRRFRSNKAEYIARGEALLSSVGLGGFGQKFPWQLSGGMQQRSSLCRALVHEPEILMLDEPSLGIAPKIVSEIAQAIVRLNRETGISVILVEQNARLALKTAHHAYVFEQGTVIRSGSGQELLQDAFVQKAFLGV